MSEDPNSLMQILEPSYLCSQYLGTSFCAQSGYDLYLSKYDK